jgi:hypothetical protein
MGAAARQYSSDQVTFSFLGDARCDGTDRPAAPPPAALAAELPELPVLGGHGVLGQVPGANDWGGRVPAQEDTPCGVDFGAVDTAFRRLARRRWAQLSRVEQKTAKAILVDVDFTSGRYKRSTMALRARAQVSRSKLFDALGLLEGLGFIERQIVDPCFEACCHVVERGWEGFRSCNRLAKRAEAAGKPYTCVAHHGMTILWWRATAEDVEKALGERERTRVRVRRYGTTERGGARGSKPSGTPTPKGTKKPYGTPHPPSGSLKSLASPSPTFSDPYAGRADGARDDSAPPAPHRPSGPGSTPPAQAQSGCAGAAHRSRGQRAAARSTPVRAASGFASDRAAQTGQSFDGGGSPAASSAPSPARGDRAPSAADASPRTSRDPSPPPADDASRTTSADASPTAGGHVSERDVDLVVDAHAVHVRRVPGRRAIAGDVERGCIRRALRTYSVLDLCLAMQGIRELDHDHASNRALGSFLRDDAQLEARILAAIGAARRADDDRWRERQSGPPVQVVKSAAAVAHHRGAVAEIPAGAVELSRRYTFAGDNPEEQARIAAEYRALFGREIGSDWRRA